MLDTLTYSGNLANLAPVADSPTGTRFVQGDIRDAELLDELFARHRRGRALRRREPRRPLGARRRASSSRRTCSARSAARRGAARTTSPLRARLHRRGLRLDRRRVVVTRTARSSRTRPYSASKAGSDLLARATHRTHGLNVSITRCSNNYGPYQFPEKVIPLFVTNLIDGKQRAALRRRRQRPRLAARRRPHAAASRLVLVGGRAGRDLQHRRRHRADEPRAHRAAARGHRARTGRTSTTSPTASATTCATRSTSRRSGPSSATRRRCRSSRASPTSCSGTATTAAWWEPLKARAGARLRAADDDDERT